MTTENPPSDEEGLGDDIFGTDDTYEASSPYKREFLPWHKPRKQFVRHHQWCLQIQELINEGSTDTRMLKYLGLPGVDLLDLRYFHTQICEPNNIQLRFLGFNSGAQPGSPEHTELNISLDEVRRLDKIDGHSEVIPDDICRIADKKSIAWKKATEFGPFDVVNLDLCNSFATHSPCIAGNTNYSALHRLITLQARRKDPWLLFLTTRTGHQDINEEVLIKLQNKYKKNLSDCPGFKVASKQFLNIEDDATLNAVAATPDGHLSVFLVGLCKWMLGLTLGQNPPCKIEVKSTIGYRVNMGAAHDDLVSIALRFEPTFEAIDDPIGLSAMPVIVPDECSLSVKVLGRVIKRICADEIIAKNSALFDQLTLATENLLELARYDVDAYRVWMRTN